MSTPWRSLLAVVGAYATLSCICFYWPDWVFYVTPMDSIALVAVTVLGPPALLLIFGAEALYIFAWSTAIIAGLAVYSWAQSRTDPGGMTLLFTLVAWFAIGPLALAAGVVAAW